MKTLVVAGGTGGHIYPALALAQELKTAGDEITWGGSLMRMESGVASEHGMRFIGFDIRRPFEGIFWLFKDIKALFSIVNAIKKGEYDRMICAGGYITFFFILGAKLNRLKFYLLEQNVLPGRVTRLAARYAEKVFLAFPESREMIARGNCVVTGNPVRNAIYDVKRTGGCLTVLGGSLGARAINYAVLEMITEGYFQNKGIKVLWITGKRDHEKIIQKAGSVKDVEIFAYRKDMEDVYRQTDYVISRAGATVLAELFVSMIPGILIPYPYAKDDHQTVNAMAAVNRGKYLVVKEDDNFVEGLKTALEKLLKNEIVYTSKPAERAVVKIIKGMG